MPATIRNVLSNNSNSFNGSETFPPALCSVITISFAACPRLTHVSSKQINEVKIMLEGHLFSSLFLMTVNRLFS